MKHIKQSKKKNLRNYKGHKIFQIIYPVKYISSEQKLIDKLIYERDDKI